MFLHAILNKPLKNIPRTENIFTATPLFLRDDVGAFGYFRDYIDEIDKVTGSAITVFLAKQVEVGDAGGIVRIFDKDTDENKRFPGVQRGDLPCIWIEDKDGRHSVVKISDDMNSAKQIIRFLADEAGNADSAGALKGRIESRMRGDLRERNPFVKWLEELPMFNLPNDKVAIVAGAVFLATMLVIAFLVPQPSPFQYFVFRSVLAISAAAFATAIPGILDIKLGDWLKASGALAVLVLVFLINPAALVTH